MKLFRDHFRGLIDILILSLALVFMFQYIPLEHLFENTIVTGGDTGSHYKTAAYLKDHLLPQGKVIGWYPGNYGGYPVFILYFPLLYLASVAMSAFMPLQVAFKLVTIVGPLMLPFCVYAMLRLVKFRFPGPLFGALASVLFLFNTSNSMWGGNFYSTLAGEFSYAVSFSLTFPFLGLLFRLFEDQRDGKPPSLPLILSGVFLLYLIGLTHGFTLILSSLCTIYFLLSPSHFLRKSALLIVIFGVGGLLFAGWFMQLYFNLPYSTAFNLIWSFGSISEVLPKVLAPPMGLFLVYTVWGLIPQKYSLQLLTSEERRVLPYVWFIVVLSTIAYFSSETLKLPDIRFIPFIHLLAVVFGGAFLAAFIPNSFVKGTAPFIVFCVMAIWLSYNPHDVKSWTLWNYKGFENAPRWTTLKEIREVVRGDFSDPRVVYEHNAATNSMGTVRAMESLPYFAGRATLEGLYFQSSLLSPAVFYMQSLYSKEISCPFPDFPCSRFDLKRAVRYFDLFNVNEIVLVSAEAKQQVRKNLDTYGLMRAIQYSPYEIWKIRGPRGYVKVLDKNPEYVKPDNFRHVYYKWLRSYSDNSTFLYTVPTANARVYGLNSIPNPAPVMEYTSAEAADCKVEEEMGYETVEFTTTCPGMPHLIKVSYHPGWQVEGAKGVYLASPSFLMVYPDGNKVTLRFDNAGPRAVGLWMNALGVLLLIGLLVLWAMPLDRRNSIVEALLSRLDRPIFNKAAYAAFLVGFLMFAGVVAHDISSPGFLASFKLYERYYTAKDYKTAQRGFASIVQRWPDAPNVDGVYYFLGLAFYLDANCPKALPEFKKIYSFLDSEFLAEAYYHVGVCSMATGDPESAKTAYRHIVDELDDPVWSGHAKARLNEY